MTIDLHTVATGALLGMISVIGWFLRRDIARFEKMMETHHLELSKHNELLAVMAKDIATVLNIGKWNENLTRFFGDNGGHARLWRNIESLQFDMEQCRERHHWIVNRITVIKGSMESQNLKCGSLDGTGWSMPEWKTMKEKEVK